MGVTLDWSSSYPDIIDTIDTNFPTLSNNINNVRVSHVNELAKVIVALENAIVGILTDGEFAGTQTGTMLRVGTSSYSVRKDTTAEGSPSGSNNFAAGYTVGSRWLDTLTGTLWICYNDGVWENTLNNSTFSGSQTGALLRTGAGTYSARKDNYSSSADPASTDAFSSGYQVGSLWVNTTAGRVWSCIGDGLWSLLGPGAMGPSALATTAGTKALWLFNGNLNDSGPGGNTLTQAAGTVGYTAGAGGRKAAYMGGASPNLGYLETTSTNLDVGAGSMSLEVVGTFRPIAAGTNQSLISAAVATSIHRLLVLVTFSGGVPGFVVGFDYASSSFVSLNTPFIPDQRHVISYTRTVTSTTTHTLYLDGVQVSTATDSHVPYSSGTAFKFRIGNIYNTDTPLTGDARGSVIEQVHVTTDVLSAAAVASRARGALRG